jgi:polyferredoxin
MDARVDLTAGAATRRLLKWDPLRFMIQAFLVAMFLMIIGAGLFGSQNPALNVAPLLTWTLWWAGLVFLILYAGKLWCSVCPWDAMATWFERLKLWGPREDGLGLGLRWPRKLKNIWPAVVLFVLLTWVELGMGVTTVPRVTAYLALGMLGMAVVSALVFDRKAFCRYGCLVGRVSGLYALFSPLELRTNDPETCAGCRTMDCYRGNAQGDGCPTFEFPRTMDRNTYCILCTDCLKTCPHDNTAIRLRPWAADLARGGKARADEAMLALILLSMTGFHGLTMTPRWAEWSAAFEASSGLGTIPSFTVLMGAILVVPVAIYWVLSKLAALAAGLPTRTIFLHYAYSLLPIALFYHLAHNAEHFLMEGPKIVALASDPFGWGWNLFDTAGATMPPLVTLEGLWILQVFFVVVGHLYGLWIAEKTSRRLIESRWRAALGQLPMLFAMILSSVVSLWLISQPMEMRVSAM